MLPIAMLCLGLVVADEGSDLAAYRAAAKAMGKDAAAQVKLALWCESHGLGAERMKHLALAVARDPANALARGLMGMVSYNGRWERPEQVSREAKDDPGRRALMQEYLDRRAKTPETADGHLKLATWCEQNGLKSQAVSHYQRVVRLDPKRESAWKHLGYRKQGGRWVQPEQVAAARARAQEQQRADRHWKPILDRHRVALQSKSPARRADAEQALARINQPEAVPMVMAVLGHGEPTLQKAAVMVLGQIDDGSASRDLGMLAVFGGTPEVRRRATETLRRRDPREFAAMLIGLIRQPIEYEVKWVRGPGQVGELLIKGQGSAPNVKRLYSPSAAPTVLPGDRVTLDENGLPVALRPEYSYTSYYSGAYLLQLNAQMNAVRAATMETTGEFKGQFTNFLSHSGLVASAQKLGQTIFTNYQSSLDMMNMISSNPLMSSIPLVQAAAAYQNGVPLNFGSQVYVQNVVGETIPVGRMAIEAQKTAYVAEKQLENDVAAIKEYNEGLAQINDRVVPVLKEVSGLVLGPKPLEWQKWYVNLVGYRLNNLQNSDTGTVIEQVPLAYQPAPLAVGRFDTPVSLTRISCFGAGTLVRTLTGLEPIESLKVGDPVLTQSTKTGALAYRPIVVVHHNPPSKTFRVTMGGETIVSSEFHRFWKAGKGWVMARDLQVGDRLRTLDGPSAITTIEPGEVVPVYNLDVAEDNDFFVGRGGALVHDNTLPDLREKPFDAVGAMTAGPAPARARSILGR